MRSSSTRGHWDAATKSGHLLYNVGAVRGGARAFRPVRSNCSRTTSPTLQYARAFAARPEAVRGSAGRQPAGATQLDPDNADTCNNIGDALQSLGRHEEALQWFDQALSRCGRISSRRSTTRPSCSVRCTGSTKRSRSTSVCSATGTNTPATDWNLSLLQMLTGNFEAGWAGREARWKTPALAVAYPKFRATDVARRRKHRRQDHPDPCRRRTGRYHPVRALRADGGGARRARHPGGGATRVHPLLSGTSRRLAVPSVVGRTAAGVRHALPDGSLPLAFGTRLDTIPSAISYLPPPAEARVQAWEDRLGSA